MHSMEPAFPIPNCFGKTRECWLTSRCLAEREIAQRMAITEFAVRIHLS
jgi:hypothetical protein